MEVEVQVEEARTKEAFIHVTFIQVHFVADPSDLRHRVALKQQL